MNHFFGLLFSTAILLMVLAAAECLIALAFILWMRAYRDVKKDC